MSAMALGVLFEYGDTSMANNLNTMQLWEELERQGKRNVLAIRRQWRQLLNAYPDARPLSVAAAWALVWSKHAKGSDEFLNAAVTFVNRGRSGLRAAVRHSFRFSPEALERALRSWRLIVSVAGKYAAPDGVEGILAAQQELLDIAGNFYDDGDLAGVGPWLFCGPFKILLCGQPRWLRHPRESDVTQPLGMEVMRGIREMQKHGELLSLTRPLLKEVEGGLLEGMGSVLIVHGACRPVAARLGLSMTEFNTGLWWLGESKSARHVHS